MRRVATTAADPKKAHKSKQIKTRITTGYHASPAQKYTIPPASKVKENTERSERERVEREERGESRERSKERGGTLHKCCRCWPRNLQVLNVELGEMRAAALTQTNTEMATAHNRKPATNEPSRGKEGMKKKR